MKYFKTLIYKILKFFGYSLLKIEKEDQKLFFEYFPKNVVHNIKNKDTFYKVFAELDEDDLKIIDIVFKNNLTMVSFERVIDTILAVKYVVERGLDGDFVECGPYRGGNSIAAKLKLENSNSNKQLFLYDTFTGMSVPNPNIDKSLLQNLNSLDIHTENQEEDFNKWCYSSIEEVKNNFDKFGNGYENVKFIKGMVEETLINEDNLPDSIAVLRLDTDWYESTLLELEVLYPRLVKGGVLLIDDYGYWEGSRTAVEEYFSRPDTSDKPYLARSDFDGRIGIKI
tara:strand:+ start:1040 stop:1888 length:849 start_codon:yes stop_codon:yes gene_type:complete